jgi:hypothetical protein
MDVPEVLPSYPKQTGPPTGISLRATVFPVNLFVRFFCHPTAVVDDWPYQSTWGTQLLPVEPGDHSLTLYFTYRGKDGSKPRNTVTTTVTVVPGEVLPVTYITRWMLALDGKVEVHASAPAALAG